MFLVLCGFVALCENQVLILQRFAAGQNLRKKTGFERVVVRIFGSSVSFVVQKVMVGSQFPARKQEIATSLPCKGATSCFLGKKGQGGLVAQPPPAVIGSPQPRAAGLHVPSFLLVAAEGRPKEAGVQPTSLHVGGRVSGTIAIPRRRDSWLLGKFAGGSGTIPKSCGLEAATRAFSSPWVGPRPMTGCAGMTGS
jgi:hypothetical protein